MALCQSILRIISDQLATQGNVRVKKVRLEVGALSAAEPQSLQFGFSVMSRGTQAEGSVLEITTVPGRGWCVRCDAERAVFRHGSLCEHCGSLLLPRGGGDQLRVKELEIE